MRLLTKTNLYFLIVMVPLLAVAGFFLFNKFSRETDQRTDNELMSAEKEWIQYLGNEARKGNAVTANTPDFTVYPVNAPVSDDPTITDIYQFSEEAGTKILYRQLSQVVSIYGLPYQLTIKQSLEQREVLVRNVTNMMLFVFAGLFLATLIFNWAISHRLWNPFRKSLSKIRGAELNKLEAVYFEKTNTSEFNELNAALNYMAGKINREYLIMKEFTENAAHEMQTPLAVIQSRLEFLLQSSNLSSQQAHSIGEANGALEKLNKLNKSLLLLAKIENNQYEATCYVSFTEVANKYTSLFTDLFQDKQIKIYVDAQSDFSVRIHPYLADSLVSNLLGNAIKYNYPSGRIDITISENHFVIKNTSHRPEIDAGKVFTRFSGSDDREGNSNGLGLAIVKSIGNLNGLNISYSFSEGLHTFRVSNAGWHRS
ncbi:MAG: HAMP domain-containing sensor histidine kinase [Chitinophagaceae bacterium]